MKSSKKISCFCIVALSCLLLMGCATVRRARQAQRPENVPAGERSVTAAEIGLGSNSVLKLEEAIGFALAYRASVIQATQNLTVAAAQVTTARAALMPSVDAGASYSRSTSNTRETPASNDSDGSYAGSLSADMLLFDFGKTPAALRQAHSRMIAAMAELRGARNDVAFEVRQAYFELAQAQQLVHVSEDAVGQYAAHLDQSKAFAEVGRRTRYEVTKSEVDLGNAKLDLINASNSLITARATLNRSIGLVEEPGYQIADAEIEKQERSLDQLFAAATRGHPGLLVLKAQEAQSFAAVDEAIADLYPSLSLSGKYGASGSSFPLIWNWSGMAQLGLQLFGGGRKRAAIDTAAAQLRSARAAVADMEQQVFLELNSAMNTLQSADQRMSLTELIVRQASETLDLVGERYKLGKASAVEVTDAQSSLTSAQADNVKAHYEYQIAAARIRHAVGEE